MLSGQGVSDNVGRGYHRPVALLPLNPDELLTTTTPDSRIVPGSRATSPSLDALKALAGPPKAEPAPAPRRRGEPA